MTDGSFLSELGVKMSDLVAGFSGGVVNAFVFRRTDPVSIIGSVVVGTLTAAYLTDYVSRWFGGTGSQGVAFIVGLAGMAICQGIVSAVKNIRFPIAGGSSGGSGPST